MPNNRLALALLCCCSANSLAWELVGNATGIVHNREWVGHANIDGYTQFAFTAQVGWQTTLADSRLTLGGQLQHPFGGQPAVRPWVQLTTTQLPIQVTLGSLTPVVLHPGIYDSARNWPSWQAKAQPPWQEGLAVDVQSMPITWQAQVLWRDIERLNSAELFDVLQQANIRLTDNTGVTLAHHIAHQGGQLTNSPESLRAQTVAIAAHWQRNRWQVSMTGFAAQVNSPWNYAWETKVGYQLGTHQFNIARFVGQDYYAAGASELYRQELLDTGEWRWQVNPDVAIGLALQLSDRLLFSSQLLYWDILI